MRKFILAAAAALLAARRRGPAAAAAQAARRHLGRPVLGRPVRRIPPAVHRRPRAARVGHGVPQRLPEPRRRPRPARAIRRSSPATIRRAPGSSPTPGSTSRSPRSDKSVYCAEDETRAGHAARSHYKVSPEHLLVPTLGELMKARWPAQPQRRRRRQGPRGGDDERPQGRPALVLGRQASSRPTSPACAVPPRRAEGQCRVAAALAQRRGRRSSRRLSARPRRGRSRSRAAASRSAPAGFARAAGDADALPRLARVRRRHAGARRRRWSTKCSSAAAPRPTCSRSACRRPIMSATPTAPRARRCASS